VPRTYFVYILTNPSRTLYVGVTSDLARRLDVHRNVHTRGFTSRYHVTRLVHVERTSDVHSAIAREKQLKGWSRRKKIALIESANPKWTDLAEGL
jgi:putative endonuclease